MDFLLLDKTSFYPTILFEDYRSLIWTERFNTHGEFQLTSSNIQKTLDTFPLGSLVSLRDTTEVMMVETHSIEPNSDGTPEITITGRSLSSFLENRVLLPVVYGESWETLQDYTPQEILCLLLWNALVNDTGQDPSKAYGETVWFDYQAVVPNVVISLQPDPWDETKVKHKWSLSSGEVSTIMLDIQSAYSVGVRVIRPMQIPSPYARVSFKIYSNRNVRGLPQFEAIENDITNLRFDVYKGVNRTVKQNNVTPVIFHESTGHLIQPKYLKSLRDYKNNALVFDSTQVRPYPPETVVSPKDWDSTKQYSEGDEVIYKGSFWTATTEPDIGEEPGVEIPDEINSWLVFNPLYYLGQNVDKLTALGETEIYKRRMISMADSEISSYSPYKYGRDYFLGDIITFAGRYASETSMFINEIVRTENEEGESISPGIIQYTDDGSAYSLYFSNENTELGSNATGFDRRIMLVDAGEIVPDDPEITPT
jgi:hypothetical protein